MTHGGVVELLLLRGDYKEARAFRLLSEVEGGDTYDPHAVVVYKTLHPTVRVYCNLDL